MADVRDRYARALEHFGQKVSGVRGDQWSSPTPCSEWDVRALVNHLVYENLWVPPLLAGATIADVGDRFDGDVLGDDPSGAWSASAASALAAISAPGAMDRLVHLSFGDRAGREYAEQLFTDLVIHGWDLARATGANEAIEPEFIDVLYAESAPREDALKASGVFGDLVVPPEGADTQTRLLAIFGRVA